MIWSKLVSWFLPRRPGQYEIVYWNASTGELGTISGYRKLAGAEQVAHRHLERQMHGSHAAVVDADKKVVVRYSVVVNTSPAPTGDPLSNPLWGRRIVREVLDKDGKVIWKAP